MVDTCDKLSVILGKDVEVIISSETSLSLLVVEPTSHANVTLQPDMTDGARSPKRRPLDCCISPTSTKLLRLRAEWMWSRSFVVLLEKYARLKDFAKDGQ